MNRYDNSMSFETPMAVSRETLRSVMVQVYMWMFGGLLTTAFTAFLTLQLGFTQQINPVIWLGALVVELGLVWYLSARIHSLAPTTAIGMFFLYAAINGFTLSLIFLVYTTGSIVTAFVSAAALFAAMSLLGATTKVDLTGMGSYFMMALIGIIIASIINIFLGSSALDFAISIIGVLLFTGLTVYDTQRITRMASSPALANDSALVTRVSIMGALALYLDFINLFIFILRLVGKRR